MKQVKIHPMAYVEEGATIGNNVTIEPFAIVKKSVTLEDGVVIKSHAYIDGNTTIGEETIIYPSATIGTKTQDLKFRGEETFVKIGKRCEIRECVTINASCQQGSTVEVGNNCLIMAYCHIAHNCTVGQGVIMSNNATLAGHVLVEDYAIIGGLTGVHQFVRIGKFAMVGGLSRINRDVLPYVMVAGIPPKFGGLNRVGLMRHDFPLETRQEIAKAYKFLFKSGLDFKDALKRTEEECKPIPEIKHWLHFCKTSKRGLLGLHNETSDVEEEAEKTCIH